MLLQPPRLLVKLIPTLPHFRAFSHAPRPDQHESECAGPVHIARDNIQIYIYCHLKDSISLFNSFVVRNLEPAENQVTLQWWLGLDSAIRVQTCSLLDNLLNLLGHQAKEGFFVLPCPNNASSMHTMDHVIRILPLC